MTGDSNYRKLNDRSHNSSTYHKKDGTAIRAKLKQETMRELMSLYIVYPEKKWISLKDIETMFDDAVANSQITAAVAATCLDVDDKIRVLEDIGHITAGKITGPNDDQAER